MEVYKLLQEVVPCQFAFTCTWISKVWFLRLRHLKKVCDHITVYITLGNMVVQVNIMTHWLTNRCFQVQETGGAFRVHSCNEVHTAIAVPAYDGCPWQPLPGICYLPTPCTEDLLCNYAGEHYLDTLEMN